MTSEALKLMLEDTGLFQVDIAVSPPAKGNMKAFKPDFAAYRLVVLDYSGDDWPAATQKAFVSYVTERRRCRRLPFGQQYLPEMAGV